MSGHSGVHGATDLVVPVKTLARAKSRLRAAEADPGQHTRLVLALVLDTVAAASAAEAVRRVVVISPDPRVLAAMREAGVETLEDVDDSGLNPALASGAAILRTADPGATVGALQADLPALRSKELDEAIAACHDHGGRAFCADQVGTGTTLLLAPAGHDLDPRFGVGSAEAHRVQGAVALTGDWPGLRRDVDTAADLAAATELGLGDRSVAVLETSCAR